MTLTKEQSQSLDHLMQVHYAPVFVKTCAERGLHIENREHLLQVMETAAKVKIANERAGGSGQQQLTNAADHQLNVALFGEEKAAEIAQSQQQLEAPAVEPTELSGETKQAVALLLAPPAAEGEGEGDSK